MKYIFSIVLLSISLLANAQTLSPIKWNVNIHHEGADQWITLDASMNDEWVVYSQHMNYDGPIPTTFDYDITGDTSLDGDTEELSELIVKYSDLFEMDVKKFKHEAKFKQKIKISGHGTISVDVSYMTCSGNKCLPPKTETYKLKY